MIRPLVLTAILGLVAACAPAASTQPAASTAPTAARSIAGSVPDVIASPTTSPTSTAVRTPTPAPTAIALFGSPSTRLLDPAVGARLQAALDDDVASGTPDVIAAVVTADGMWAGAAGIDGPHGRRAQPTDEFGIASVSKLLTTALVLKLAEQGKLDLDGPIADYLGGVDVNANGATVRQALGMRSGIGAARQDPVAKAFAACDRPWSTAEVVATIPPPFAPAGSRYEYSNPTYKLVGIAAENASGRSLAEALESLVVGSADADRLLLQGPHASPPKPWALPVDGHTSGYDLDAFGVGGNLPCVGDTTLTRGAGAFASDAPSLARWAWRLFSGAIISADSVQKMTTVDDGAHGLGIDRYTDFLPDVAYGHAGSQPGYSALLAVFPQRPAVVVVFINDEQADPYARARYLLTALDGGSR